MGNPYQSFLDFNEFVEENASSQNYTNYEYATIDDNNSDDIFTRYKYYVTGQSENGYAASRYIHPHQGFFVKVKTTTGKLRFTNDMRKAGTSASLNSPFRGQLNYPLVNLLCYDEDGNRDLATVEINRPEFGGGQKMEKLHTSKGLIYAYLQNERFQTLFTPVGINTVPVHFVVNEDGVFTMNWNTLHGDFSYLHLIDNMTGMDIDCLTHSEYKFEGKTTDYKSRFKLVFDCVGVEENEEEIESESFAFMFGDDLVVNGEGTLQMFDITGRCLMSTQVNGTQNTVKLPQVSAGLYVLRIIGNKQMKVQRIVIK